jgi:hypothetical protein
MTAQIEYQNNGVKDLGNILKNHVNLASELRDWAISFVSNGDRDSPAFASKVLVSNLGYAWGIGSGKSRGISASDFIDFFTKVYGRGGPLETQKFHMLTSSTNSPEFVGALYFLASSDFNGLTAATCKRAIKTVVEVAFEDKNKWKSLNNVLLKIDEASPGCGLVAGIPDRLEALHHQVNNPNDAVLMQQAGGIHRVTAVGADLQKVFTAAIKKVDTASLYPASWPLAYAFFVDALEDLKASRKMTATEANTSYDAILKGLLSNLSRKKVNNHDQLRPILSDLTRYASKTTASSLIINLCRCNALQVLSTHRDQIIPLIDPIAFKEDVNTQVDVGDRYSVVTLLGLEHLYTPRELNALKGAKLESALGL